MSFMQATPRVAWQNKGRTHALANEPRQPPETDPERGWYQIGYRVGKTERLRKEAGAKEAVE